MIIHHNTPLLDTNIIIAIINNHENFDELFMLEHACISAMTVMELYALAGMSHKEEQSLTRFIQQLTVIPVDIHIAQRAGAMARTKSNRRHRIDIIIAATALEYGLLLITNNAKDFKGIKGLNIQAI